MDDTAARQMQGFLVLMEAIDRAGSTDPAKIQAALKATDLKPDQLMIGYKGVKFDDKGQNILAAGVIIQLQDGENYVRGLAEGHRREAARDALQGLVISRGRGIGPALFIFWHRYSNPQGSTSGMSFVLVQVIVGGLLLGAVYALFSSGLTLVWGMMNIVNFAHGDFVMLGMYVAFMVYTLLGAGPLLGAPLAVLVLATLGVIVYFGLIRAIMKGPMLAQILGTFGLALLLRYSVFWWFGANFLSLPGNIVGGTFDVWGLRIEASRLLAGVVALVVTLGLHLLLTRTSLGSKMLAVAEDSTAAQLMGIRPDTMQAIAWAIAAGATGLAGALIATFFYIVPTVGETLGIVAFVTVSLGGFGSVPGALMAGLLIGVIESLSGYLLSAVYKDIVVYSLFLGFLWFRPQGLMGKT